MTKEAYARESRRAKQNRIATEADLAVGRSTAPWDQPRNATTTTLYFPEAETADEAAIIAHLRRTRPDMKGVKVEIIHSRKPAYDFDLRGPSICCLISWTNPSYTAPAPEPAPVPSLNRESENAIPHDR